MALPDWLNRLLFSHKIQNENGIKTAHAQPHTEVANQVGIQNEIFADKQKLVNLLTPGEYAVYLQLLEGYSLKESAKQLSIKYSTANTHMSSIYRKLLVKSRAKLIIGYRNVRQEHVS